MAHHFTSSQLAPGSSSTSLNGESFRYSTSCATLLQDSTVFHRGFFSWDLRCSINQSLVFSVYPLPSPPPHQWKRAAIVPVPKISARKEHADFRSISITPVLLRILERIIVNQFIYPAILTSHRIVCDGQAMGPGGQGRTRYTTSGSVISS